MVLRAFLLSRAVVLAGALVGLFIFGTGAYEELVPAGGDPSDTLEEVLLSPARRWDAGWILNIAANGYDQSSPSATAFFPLYPLAVRIVGEPLGSFEWAGVLVSCGALLVALYLLHRLTELEIGRAAADRTVLLVAFFPMSFYLSAIYTEALFLALTVGCVYSARRGWWWRAAALGALAAATRNTGGLLIIPLAIIMLYGPREGGIPLAKRRRGWPRFKPAPRELAALAAVPVGLVAYMVYIRAATRYGFLAPIKAQQDWSRELHGPIVGLWGGVKNGFTATHHVLSGATLAEPVSADRSGLINFAALATATVGLVGACRRLPAAYWAYALAGLVVAISYPTDPLLMLKSLPRLIIVLFPIFMWFGLATERISYRAVTLAVSVAGLGLFSAMFASGYWIA